MRYLLFLIALPVFGQTNVSDVNLLGNFDAGSAVRTQPAKRGTSLPGTCTIGDQFFKSDATAGSNLYGCTATNTWSVQAGSTGTGVAAAVTTVSYSGTPTYAATKNTTEAFILTLTGNISSSTLTVGSGNPLIRITLCQDGTGGRTNVWPTNVLGAPQISADASSCTTIGGGYDGSNLNVEFYAVTKDAAGPALLYQIAGTTYTLSGPAVSGTLGVLVAAPANAASTCTTPSWSIASGFAYFCIATNTWQRVAIATW